MLLALVDDFSPTAAEERQSVVRVFFANTADRNAARFTVASRFPVAAIDVSDEDWARRSQDSLAAITIGRVTVVPNPQSAIRNPQSETRDTVTLVIVPSMGFGTGHHATTRLCLEALQSIDLAGAFVLDVGTGSGILAIAAARLGAARAIGIDNDPDAIQAAQENRTLNQLPPSTPPSEPGTRQAPSTQHSAPSTRSARVAFELSDLRVYLASHRESIDVITANLTGALLIRTAAEIQTAVRSGGTIIVSGVLDDERDDVVGAFESTPVVLERSADEWVCLTMKKP